MLGFYKNHFQLLCVFYLVVWFIEFLVMGFHCADPYLNTDAGTMSPFEHGEVFVLDDGGEVSFYFFCLFRTWFKNRNFILFHGILFLDNWIAQVGDFYSLIDIVGSKSFYDKKFHTCRRFCSSLTLLVFACLYL